MAWYVTYTPRGNVKIETRTYPRKHFLKLREENARMQKAGKSPDEHVDICLGATACFGSHDIEYFLPFKGPLMKSCRSGLRIFSAAPRS